MALICTGPMQVESFYLGRPFCKPFGVRKCEKKDAQKMDHKDTLQKTLKQKIGMQQYSKQGASNFPTQTATIILTERGPGDFVKIKWATSLGATVLGHSLDSTSRSRPVDIQACIFPNRKPLANSVLQAVPFKPQVDGLHVLQDLLDLAFIKLGRIIDGSRTGPGRSGAGSPPFGGWWVNLVLLLWQGCRWRRLGLGLA